MKKRIQTSLTIFMKFYLLVLAHTSTGSELYNLSLTGLNTETSLKMQAYEGQVLLLSFFEPECRWCYRQMKVFNRLHADCQAVTPVAVGIHGDTRSLRQELRRAQVEYPAVRANRSLISIVGEVPSTPWTVIVSSSGEIISTIQGYYPLEKWQSAFSSC